MDGFLNILKTGGVGLMGGLLYGTIKFSMNSIAHSSRSSKQNTTFEHKYPNIKYHSDLKFCVSQLQDYIMYAPQLIDFLVYECNKLMKMYITFSSMKDNISTHQNPADLILMPKKVYTLAFKICKITEDLQTQLIKSRPDLATEVTGHIQLMQKIVKEVGYNVYMDMQVAMSERSVDSSNSSHTNNGSDDGNKDNTDNTGDTQNKDNNNDNTDYKR